jgi:hemerythrin-like domain-containing protein
MSEPQVPDLGRSLILVHRVVTRGLLVTIERSRTFEKDGFPDPVTRDSFVDYVQSLATFLHGHHTAEDDIVFPALRATLTDAPYAVWARQHQAMVPLVTHMREAVAVAAGADAGAALRDVNRCAGRIEEGWHAHFKSEEEHLTSDRIAAALSADELAQLAGRIGAHNREHLQPDYLLMPFTLYNLSAEDRAALSVALPPVAVNEQVPGPWRDKWQPMASFLLP